MRRVIDFDGRCSRTRLGTAVVVAGLSLLLAACGNEAPPPPQPPEAVRVETVMRKPLSRTISLTGSVAARFESDLSFRIAGRVVRRDVDVSDHVKAGQVLATLETEEQEADVRSAEATLTSAEASLTQAEANFERQKKLLSSGFTTRSTFDTAQEQLRTARGSLESARADVATAKDQLSFTVLRAESDGIVTSTAVETGQVVASAQTVLTVARDGDRDAVFDVYEALLTGAPPAGPIEIKLVSDPSVTAKATPREISPTFDAATGTVRVKASLIDPPAALSLGAAITGVAPSAPMPLFDVPWTALSSGASGPALWVVDSATAAVKLRPVSVERYGTGRILVRDGLSDGDVVVVAAGQFLHDGQVVSIVKGDVR